MELLYYEPQVKRTFILIPTENISLDAYYTSDYKNIVYCDEFPFLYRVYSKIICNILCANPNELHSDECMYFINKGYKVQEFINTINIKTKKFLIDKIANNQIIISDEYKIRGHIDVLLCLLKK